MTSLEHQLHDLGGHLDHPSGDQIVAAVRARLSSPTGRPPPRVQRLRRRVFVAALASAAAATLLAVAIPPSRDAIEDILGLGSSEVGQPLRPTVPPRSPTSGPTITTTPPRASVSSLDLEAARAVVDFPIRVPANTGAEPLVTVDHRVPGGLVALVYPTFTVVEVASPPDAGDDLLELIDPESHVRLMSVRGRPGMWITGPHPDVTYLDRDGNLRRSAARTGGNVLLWEEGSVTYRIEGFVDEASAAGMASSMS